MGEGRNLLLDCADLEAEGGVGRLNDWINDAILEM